MITAEVLETTRAILLLRSQKAADRGRDERDLFEAGYRAGLFAAIGVVDALIEAARTP